ncbi:MAG TPA: hypothetical protein VEP49_17260, partial [Acidimicrobiia bacterium]|nr:hypothetical protein [Acidimicrobiia bacterium]
RVYVFVSDDTESRQAIVVVSSVTNWDVTPTPDVYRYVATRAHNIAFGALSVYERRDAKCNVNLHHSLLAATLDPDELVNAVAAVAAVADKIDDEVATRFGGKRSIEPGTAARKPVGDTRVR